MTISDKIREIIGEMNKLMMRGATYENSAKLRNLSNRQNKLMDPILKNTADDDNKKIKK